jgi:hypothetical protein
MNGKEKLNAAGKKQQKIVMDTFHEGKLRRPGGKTITNPQEAVAASYSEGRAAQKRGTSERTYMGRRRRRPNPA